MTQCPNNFRVTQKTLKSAPHILRACDLSLKSRLISACCPTQAFDQPHRHRPSLAQQFLNSSTANKQRQQADMSMATALTGVPVARAFTATTLRKPRSAQSARRAPLPIRASGDPAAPDKAEVKDEVVDCEFSTLSCAPVVLYSNASVASVDACPATSTAFVDLRSVCTQFVH